MAVTLLSDSLNKFPLLPKITFEVLYFSENNRRIMTTKTESIAQRSTHLTVLTHSQRKIEVAVNLCIQRLDIDSRRYNAFGYSHHAGQRLDCSSATQQMARHRLS